MVCKLTSFTHCGNPIRFPGIIYFLIFISQDLSVWLWNLLTSNFKFEPTYSCITDKTQNSERRNNTTHVYLTLTQGERRRNRLWWIWRLCNWPRSWDHRKHKQRGFLGMRIIVRNRWVQEGPTWWSVTSFPFWNLYKNCAGWIVFKIVEENAQAAAIKGFSSKVLSLLTCTSIWRHCKICSGWICANYWVSARVFSFATF